ncbi:MAG TPA: hypothetical protein VK674_07040 [Candidatus Limnocylindria bacterium]|nr:hypothetical protein [Candidatus Limnocylindria bacterium]
MRKSEDQAPEGNLYSQLEAMLQPGTDIPGAVQEHDRPMSAANAKIDTLRFTLEGLTVSIRRYVDRVVGGVPDNDMKVMIMAASPGTNLPLGYADGFEEDAVGGAFAVKPDGEFSNSLSLSWSCREHGPLTHASQDMLIQLALGNTVPPNPAPR